MFGNKPAPFLLGALLSLLFITPFPASAQTDLRLPPELISVSAVVMDASTGTIVFSKNPDFEIPPASLTKLMTMHLAFKEIEAGRASLDEAVILGRESLGINQPPLSSIMNLARGQTPSLRELLLGMAIFSGNDAATAVALRFAPSVKDFAERMTQEAQSLNLQKTRFVDASGYSEDNMTTAREFTEFCRIYLKEHPDSLRDFHSLTSFSYGTRVQRNRNNLVGRVEGVDGLKTGFIFESGYNIALTAERNGTRFIIVILGGPAGWGGDRVRDDEGRKLIEFAFENYRTLKPQLAIPGPVRLWKGSVNEVDLVFGIPMDFTVPIERGKELREITTIMDPIIAPLASGTQVGNIVLYDSLGELRDIPLLLANEVEKGGFFKRLFDSIRLFFRGLKNRF